MLKHSFQKEFQIHIMIESGLFEFNQEIDVAPFVRGITAWCQALNIDSTLLLPKNRSYSPSLQNTQAQDARCQEKHSAKRIEHRVNPKPKSRKEHPPTQLGLLRRAGSA